MRTFTHMLQFALAALVVIGLGVLIGWYVFVHRSVVATTAQDLARGAGTAAPFGAPAGSTFTNSASSVGTEPATVAAGSGAKAAPRLWHVSAAPIAGMTFLATSSTTTLLFVERANGNVLSAIPGSGAVTRLTNSLFPKTYDALLVGTTTVLRSVDDRGVLTTFLGRVTAATSSEGGGSLLGAYLPEGVVAIGARSATQLVFLVRDPHGGVVGVTSDLMGKNQKRIFASALSGWRLLAPGDGSVILAQAASDGIDGYSFTLAKDGSLTPLVGGLPGLVVAPRASSTALIWSESDGGLTLFARTSAGASQETLSLHTTAEKCVWAPSAALVAYCAVPQSAPTGQYLLNWYAGAIHTSDAWWRVDVSAGTAQQFFMPDSTTLLDVVDPTIDPTGTYLAFKNDADQSLWVLRIAQ